ncbi:hypothetical protein C8P65_12111 [Capnocytophaga leadbetteri]|uniref:Lipoprotein n=1 Tax=Capnocytophaga leadbetteri TaxID=327575 RepID=A0A2T5XRW1_9FLAO|nr:hypothetical protein [Capnocytophaga leadbetteri]PTX01352.1 hypothetical protein C8P65_12111 [Capnocytophaga leadbetteri]
MKKRFLLLSLLLISLSISLNSCLGVKPATSGGGKKYFESYYVGDEGNQYFIKPLALVSEYEEAKATLDISFRSKESLQGTAQMNFSVYMPEAIHSLKSVYLYVNNTSFELSDVKLLFVEREKNSFQSRFSTTIPAEKLKSIFNTSDWQLVIIKEKGKTYKFDTASSSKKRIEAINSNLFTIFK